MHPVEIGPCLGLKDDAIYEAQVCLWMFMSTPLYHYINVSILYSNRFSFVKIIKQETYPVMYEHVRSLTFIYIINFREMFK